LEQSISADTLIKDIQRVASLLNKKKLTLVEYRLYGDFSDGVVHRIFNGWRKAIEAADLEPGRNTQITEEDLFDNLEQVWRRLGRQPRVREVAAPLSKYSSDVYRNRYHGWHKSLDAFVAAVGQRSGDQEMDESTDNDLVPISVPVPRARTPRTANWRLRFLTLRRDGFRCTACGRSPANDPGVELEVDHIIPWSSGGESILENLQSLCKECNVGKSNLPFSTD
jgi:hypothetical protein